FFLFGSDDALAFAAPATASVAGEGRNDISMSLGFHRLTGQWRHRFTHDTDNRLLVTVGTDVTKNSLGKDLKLQLDLGSLALRDEMTWRFGDSLSLVAGA